jgi:hypothetical protein
MYVRCQVEHERRTRRRDASRSAAGLPSSRSRPRERGHGGERQAGMLDRRANAEALDARRELRRLGGSYARGGGGSGAKLTERGARSAARPRRPVAWRISSADVFGDPTTTDAHCPAEAHPAGAHGSAQCEPGWWCEWAGAECDAPSPPRCATASAASPWCVACDSGLMAPGVAARAAGSPAGGHAEAPPTTRNWIMSSCTTMAVSRRTRRMRRRIMACRVSGYACI